MNQPSDCWPRWSNQRYGDFSSVQKQQRQTPPRKYQGHPYSEYNYGNDMGSVPQSFGGGRSSQYYERGEYGTTTNTPNSYTATNPWETDNSSQNWSLDPWDTYESYENSRKNPSESYESYRNSPQSASNLYESYQNSPKKEGEYHTPNYAPGSYDGYGRGTYGRYDTPPARV